MSAAETLPSIPRPGDRIGGYEVVEVLRFGAPVALLGRRAGELAEIEVLPPTADSELRILRATRALEGLDDPAAPRPCGHGLDAEAGLAWLATDHVPGERLSDLLLTAPVPWPDAARAFADVARALSRLHARGLAHRNLTPAHVAIGSDGRGRLSGFDLALDTEALAALGADAPLGDLSYVAPEVIADPNHHGPRADLYALGCTLYEALTGRAAFTAAAWSAQADPQQRVLEWKTRAEALDPGEDAAPGWLCQLVRKATDPDPDRRLPDIEAFVGWLEASRATWDVPDAAGAGDAGLDAAVPAPPLLPTLRPGSTLRPPRAPGAPTVAPGPPPMLLYVASALLGLVAGLALGAVVIVFVEMRLGG